MGEIPRTPEPRVQAGRVNLLFTIADSTPRVGALAPPGALRVSGMGKLTLTLKNLLRRRGETMNAMKTKNANFRLLSLFVVLSVIIPAILSGPVQVAMAAQTLWLDPTSDTGYGSNNFSNADRAYHDDTQYASGTSYSWSTLGQAYSGYNTNIPTGSTIQGIEVQVHYWMNSNSGTNSLQIALWNASDGNYTSTRQDMSEPTTQATRYFGSSSDLWGTGWTASDINNLQVRVRGITDRAGGRTFNLDWVSIQVTYIAANASVSGQVYRDTNGNGTHDPGETTGIANITVWARRQSDNVIVATTSTDANGNYTLSGLLLGSYNVDADQNDPDLPANYGVTSTDPLPVTLTESEVVTGRDFGFTLLSSLGDRVWYDVNHDGLQDTGEASISGVTVRLYRDNGNGVFEPGGADALVGTQTTSSAAANYNFTALRNGSYWVQVDTSTLPNGRTDLTGGVSPRLVTISAFDTVVTDADFGYDDSGVIGGLLWNDLNGDGTFNGADTGLNNWQVSLTDAFGAVVSINTNSSGAYSFIGLSAGTYTVTVNVPAGWAQTNNQEHPLVINLATGQPYNTADFGYSPNYASISGYVWYDANRNGIRDAGETGINAVGVTLRGGGSAIATDSNVNGFYFFGGQTVAVAGNYIVDVNQADPDLGIRVPTTPDPLNVLVTLGQNYPNRNFGFAEPAPVVKPLYLRAGDLLNRNLPTGSNVTAQIFNGQSHSWQQSSVLAQDLVLTNQPITASLHLFGDLCRIAGYDPQPVTANFELFSNHGTIDTASISISSGGYQVYPIPFVPSGPLSLHAGDNLGLRISVSCPQWYAGSVTVYYDGASYPSALQLPTYSYLRIDTGNSGTYDVSTGQASDTFLATDTISFTLRALDPFGYYDITGATLTIPGVVTNQAMTRVATPDDATAVYQYSRSGFTLGSYTYIMTATEGAEGQVTGVYTGTFRVIVSDLTESFKEARSYPGGALITQAAPGDVIQYTLHISNTGDAIAHNVTITDAIPAHATYVVGSVVNGNYTANAITWSGALAGHTERTITFRVTLDPVLDNGLAVDNVVLINDGSNTFSRNNRVTVVSSPDLSTSRKTVTTPTGNPWAEPGDILTYRITLTNTGNMNASASLVDVVPANTTLVDGSLSPTSGNASYNPGNRTISWYGTVHGANVTLGAGPGVETITFQALVNSPLNNGTLITNTAFIDDGFVPNGTTPLQSQVVTLITSQPVIQASSSKIVDEPTVAPGGVLHYHIYLNNSGKMNAPTVNLTDTVPAHTTYVAGSLRSNLGTPTWDSANNRILWTGPVNPSAAVEVHFNVRAESVLDNGIDIINTALVNDNYPPHANPFNLQATTTIVSAPDLRTSFKTVTPNSGVTPGTTLAYEIHLANTGNMTATTRITDTLSTDLVNVAIVSPPEAVYGAGAITWAGSVGPGPNTVIRFTANVRNPLDSTQTTIYNTVRIDDGFHTPYDIYPPTQTTVNASPDLSTSRKAVNTPTSNPGDVLTYTITLRNNPPGNMNTYASVQDGMPNQTTYVPGSLSFSGGGGSYDTFNRWIQWEGMVNVGQPVVITYAVTIDPVMSQPDTIIYNDAHVDDGVHAPFLTPGITTTVHAEPNLSTSTKVVNLSDAVPGQQLWYRITVRNTGNMVAYSASVSDTLPTQVSYLSGQFPTGGGYNAVNRYVYWNGNVTPGTDVIIDYYVTVNTPLDNGTHIINTAEIRDGYTGHAPYTTSPATDTVVDSAPNLNGSVKSVDRGTAAPGNRLHYGITLNNTGNMNATNVTVTDTLPSQYVTLVATPPGATYNAGNGTLVWTGLTVNRNQPVALAFDLDLASVVPNGTSIINNATIDDGFTGHATVPVQATTIIGSAPNLSASTKTVDTATAAPDNVLTYTITLHNNGNAAAVNALFTDTLPLNTTWDAWVTQNGANRTGNTLTWTGNVATTADQVIAFRVRVNSPLDNNTVIANSATVDDNVGHTLTLGPVQTAISSAPDVSTSAKAVNTASAAPGQQLYYTVTVANTGNMVAHNAEVLDAIPVNTTYVNNSAAVAGGGAVTFESIYNRIRWTGDVTPGTNVVITFRVQIAFPLNDGVIIRNWATVDDKFHSSTLDTNTVTTVIGSTPNMNGSTKTVDRATASPNDQLRYTIMLVNSGTMAATAHVDDVLPIGVTFVSGPAITGGGVGNWDSGGQRIYWDGTVAPNQTVTIVYYVSVNNPLDNGTAITNTATINDGVHAAFQTAPATLTTITSAPDLSTSTKSVDRGTAAPGNRLHYGITLNNTGNMNATNVTVVDTLPSQYVTLVATPPGATYDAVNRTLTWNALTVNRNQPVVLTLDVDLAPVVPDGTAIVNHVEINDGFNPGVVAREATTMVGSAPNLSTSTKEVSLASAAPNDMLVYTLTLRNNGNATAVNAMITDALPTNTYWDSWVAQPVGVNMAANTVTWTGNVAPGVDVVIAFRVHVNTPLDNGTVIANSVIINDHFGNHVPFTLGPVQTTIHSMPNLGTSVKAVSLADARPGNVLAYTVTLVNTGDMVAHNAIVLDEIPVGTSYVNPSVGATSGNAQYQAASRRIRWTGEVAPGTNVVITFRAQADLPLNDGTTIDNVATVEDGVHNPFDTNTVTTRIHSEPILSTSSKTVDLADAVPGQVLHYIVTLTNTGDMAAAAAVVDDLPLQVGYTSGPTVRNGPPASWDPIARRISWSGQVVPGTAVVVEYYVTVNSSLDDGIVITNTVTINDGAGVTFETPATRTTVHSAPNLATSTKQVDKPTAAPGEAIEYVVTLKNNGNTNAATARMTDTLPAQVSYVSGPVVVGGGTASYNALAGQVVWSGPVNVGQPVTIRYTVRVNADAARGSVVTNTATVDDGRGHVFQVGPAQTYVGYALGLRLTDERDTIQPGERITYTIAFSGTEPLNNGRVQLNLPDHTTFVAASAGYLNSGGTVFWLLDPQLAGYYGERYVVGQVDPVVDNGTVLSGAASVSGDGQSNQMSENVTVVSAPNWATSAKIADRYSVEPGARFTYTLQLTNTGNMDGDVVTMTDALPAQVTFAGGPTSLTGVASYDAATQSVTWKGPILAGSAVTVTFAVTVNSDVPQGTPIENTAYVSDQVNQPTPLFCAVTTVAREARMYRIYLPLVARNQSGTQLPDLTVTAITVTPANPVAGQPVDLAVTLRNQGTLATSGCFWTDLYINPIRRPQYNDTWDQISSEGLTWYVCGVGIGESITLRINDSHFRPDYSRFSGTFAAPITYTLYAQVDNWNSATSYGGVYESDEQNNVYGPQVVPVRGAAVTGASLESKPSLLPVRPDPTQP